jgi:hypothetical protein
MTFVLPTFGRKNSAAVIIFFLAQPIETAWKKTTSQTSCFAA